MTWIFTCHSHFFECGWVAEASWACLSHANYLQTKTQIRWRLWEVSPMEWTSAWAAQILPWFSHPKHCTGNLPGKKHSFKVALSQMSRQNICETTGDETVMAFRPWWAAPWLPLAMANLTGALFTNRRSEQMVSWAHELKVMVSVSYWTPGPRNNVADSGKWPGAQGRKAGRQEKHRRFSAKTVYSYAIKNSCTLEVSLFRSKYTCPSPFRL